MKNGAYTQMSDIVFIKEDGDFESIRELKEALRKVSNAACGICDQYDYHGNYRIYEVFKEIAEEWLESALEAKVVQDFIIEEVKDENE